MDITRLNMYVGVAIVGGFVANILLLFYRYEEPAENRRKLTGHGGDFAEQVD